MQPYRTIYVGSLVSMGIGMLVVLFYFAYIDVQTLQANKTFWSGDQLDWTVFGVTMAIVGMGNLLGMVVYTRPLLHWERHPNPGEAPPEIQQRAIAYPQYLALISLIMAGLAGLFFAQGGLMFFSSDLTTFLRTFLGVAVVGGSIIAMLVFLISEQAWRPHLARFLSHAIPQIGPWRLSVGVRLSLTLLLTGLVPLLVLGAIARNSAIDIAGSPTEALVLLGRLQRTFLFLVAVAIVSNLVLGVLSVQSLLAPLRRLTGAMEQVAAGDLHTRVPIMGSDELSDLSVDFNRMVAELAQGQRMRDLFGRYVSREVADQVLARGAALGGEQVQASVLFADIRDFTTLSERLPAPQVVDMLNRYFTRMVTAISEAGGLVNKFGGDSILAIFGAPIPHADHALRALRAAARMRRALAEFNAEQRTLGLPELAIGIGIASGDVVAGNIGGTERMEYTVIGDAVNLAARLQALTKDYRRGLLLSERTVTLLPPGSLALESLGAVQVKGKQQSVQIYTPALVHPQSIEAIHVDA